MRSGGHVSIRHGFEGPSGPALVSICRKALALPKAQIVSSVSREVGQGCFFLLDLESKDAKPITHCERRAFCGWLDLETGWRCGVKS